MNKRYWLSVYPKFNKSDSGIRYYLWCYDELIPSEDKLIFKCKSKCELRIFMDLNGLKVIHYTRISRDSGYHKNKIAYASFSCGKYNKG